MPRPLLLLLAVVAVFLAGIGVWANAITADLGSDIGQGRIALALAAVAAAALIGAFIWLVRKGDRSGR
jgi:hypothetical protein